jgi:hypothetical protein
MKVALVVGVLAIASPAIAHFKLVSPAASFEQDTYGSPQKSAPCGQADPNDPAVPTNAVTQLMTGQMISIEIDETIYHPGHYRVSLAETMAALPADPPVTTGATACGSTAINPSPTMPLLADGLLVHTSRFQTNQTMQVQLPAGYKCTNCVLQVTEFMSSHAAPCYYHHCAVVTISDDPNNPPIGGDSAAPKDDGGCASTQGHASGLFALLVGALLLRGRRSSSLSHRG